MLETVTFRATLLAVATLTCASAYAIADTSSRINIAAGDLEQALLQLSNETGTSLVYRPEQVRGLQTGGAHGELTTEQAVTELLKGTRLKLSVSQTGSMLIAAPGSSNALSKSEEKEGRRGRGGDAPREGLRLAQTAEGVAGGDTSVEKDPNESSRQNEKTPRVELKEVVVTGTHIRGVAPDSSPLMVYSRADIDRTGAGTVEQFLRSLPQNFQSVSSVSANTVGGIAGENTSRGAGVDLRGLGPGSTLVLINGHRLAPSGFDGSFVDPSLIPLSALERVEVLTDGASALYGADAVGGVVNFILRKDYAGAESSVRGSDATRGGDTELTASQLFGMGWSGGGALMSFEFDHGSGLDAGRRSFIPEKGGPYELVPSGRRYSGIVSVNQTLGDRWSIDGDFLLSRRTFVQGTTLPGGFGYGVDQGFARQTMGAVSLTAKLFGDWRAVITPEYAQENDEDVSLFVQFPPAANILTGTTERSLELSADGSLFKTRAGIIRASIGASFRREEFDNHSDSGIGAVSAINRNLYSAYSELFVPLVSDANAVAMMRRLELSLAARYDRYGAASDLNTPVSAATTPKVGLLWSLFGGLNVRGTFGRSFRAAPLSQLDARTNVASLDSFPDPESPTGIRNTLDLGGGNVALRPESAKVYTFGIDYRPESQPLILQTTYFHIVYHDRIANPPLPGGSPFFLYSELATLAPFVNLSPSTAQIADVYNNFRVVDESNPGSGGPTAIFDERLQNIGEVTVSGVDATAKYRFSSAVGAFSPFVSATYLRELRNKAAATTPTVNLINTPFNPVSKRARGGVTWDFDALSSSATLNYVGSYANNFHDPSEKIVQWFTLDLQAVYQWRFADAEGRARPLTLSLSVLNAFDRNPPSVTGLVEATNLNFDPTNANALGREVALQVTKKW
jgi:iron complex outermembrane recepter protein